MIRTQIQFEERQYEQIRNLAHRNRISIAEVVRRLVRAGLRAGLDEQDPAPEAQSLLDLAGISRSGAKDLGRRHDRYLDEDLAR
jgi:hypothetical protein